MNAREDADVPPAGAPRQGPRVGSKRSGAPPAGAARSREPLRSPPLLPTMPNGKLPKIAESLRGLDAAAEALERAQLGDRKAALLFLAHCMAVRRNADQQPTKQANLQKALAERGLRAGSSDRSKFTLVVKYAEQHCSLSSALRSIYVAVLEHAYAHEVEAAAVPEFVTGRGGLNKCAAAYRASRRGDGGAPRDDARARATQASKGKPSVRMAAIRRGETATFVALLLKRDPKREGYWMAVGHKPADEKMIRALLPKPSGR
jgi:hypothetical protein